MTKSTPTADDVERVAALFKRHHRDSCYPDAMDFEAEAFAREVLAAIPSPIPAGDISSVIGKLQRLVGIGRDRRCNIAINPAHADICEEAIRTIEALSLISLGEGGEGTDLRALSGSCPTGQARSGLDASRCDPGQGEG